MKNQGIIFVKNVKNTFVKIALKNIFKKNINLKMKITNYIGINII